MAETIKILAVVVRGGMIEIQRSSGGPIKYSPSQAEVFLKLWREDPEYYFLTPEFLDKFERAINRHKSLADLKL